MRIVAALACVALGGCSFALARAPNSEKSVECSGVTTAIDFGVGVAIPAGTAVAIFSSTSTPGLGAAPFLTGSLVVGAIFFVSALYGTTVETSCRDHNAHVEQAQLALERQILAARERIARSSDCAVILPSLETLRKLDPASHSHFLQTSSVVRDCLNDHLR
ncbi:MAG TPA: hypothetical protein VL326_25395 [Kofleriaceae bacterium]|jgi:hypothetical protein|nr:hypothetical protein [Kofleriaceae bacterium]